ncbi:hypothetical protein GEMRC1_001925 [Eukaryota sp. GEM-RC1]
MNVNLDCKCCCEGTFKPNLFKKSQCGDCYHNYDTHKRSIQAATVAGLCGDCQHAEIAHGSPVDTPAESPKAQRAVGKLGDRLSRFQVDSSSSSSKISDDKSKSESHASDTAPIDPPTVEETLVENVEDVQEAEPTEEPEQEENPQEEVQVPEEDEQEEEQVPEEDEVDESPEVNPATVDEKAVSEQEEAVASVEIVNDESNE